MKESMQQQECRKNMTSYVMGVMGVIMVVLIGIGGCSWFERDRQDSPTGPAGSAIALGNYAQQSGQSRIVTVNGETHQINGVVSGSVVAGGLYLEINEQSSVGSPAGTDQVAVSLQDVKITFTGLSSGVSAVKVSSNGAAIGQYAVSSGSVEIALSYGQWTQWFGPTHYAVLCTAVGSGQLSEAMAGVAGRLPSGEVVMFGKGVGGGTTGGNCPACPPGGTCNPNGLPVFVNNGNGTVTDTRTGLIWLQNANCNGAQDWTTQMAWAAGLASPACGLSDGSTAGQWRLPTVKELQNLLDYTQWNPALPAGHPFTNVQNNWYWTSTDYAPGSTLAWGVYVGDGEVNAVGKTATYRVWAVR
jgi:hypothetical protein